MAAHVKIAISLPREEFRRVERERRRTRKTRSRVIREALTGWFGRNDEERAIREYVESYRKFPERDDEEARTWAELGLKMLAGGDWK